MAEQTSNVTKSDGGPNSKRVLGVFALAMITVALVASLRGMPSMAEYGFSSVFFYILIALVFLVPVALVSAELATGWPREGGVYVWVYEAFGERWGFLAIWLEWIENVIWFPTVLSFTAGAVAYIINPDLASNHWFLIVVMLSVYWIATLANFRGMRFSSLISTVGVIAGTVVPGIILFILAALWLIEGKEVQISMGFNDLIPSFSNINTLTIAASAFLTYAGIEAVGAHAENVRDPGRDYPRALFISVIMILVIFIPVTLAIAIVVPQNDLSLVYGLMQAFKDFLDGFNMGWAVPILATLTAIGAIGMISTWIVAPTRGMRAAARRGDLPVLFGRANAEGIPVPILIAQAIMVTLIALMFVFMPGISSVYLMLTLLTTQLYVLMYIIMYAAAIKLRASQPDVHRTYRVPGGKYGIYLIAGGGFFFCIIAIIIGFSPPSQIKTGNDTTWFIVMGGGFVFFTILPMIIYKFRKPGWKTEDFQVEETSESP